MSERIYFVAHGKVQGVCFRDFTRKRANEYGVTGWCRNTSDNKVEGEAQGSDDAMNKFFKVLSQGPRHAEVESLETEGRDIIEGESIFEIRY